MKQTAPKDVSQTKPSATTARPSQKSSSVDTKQTSFDMLKKDWSIEQIAKERGLVRSTIERHLSHFVANGELEIARLLPPEKLETIQKALTASTGNSLKEVKESLGADYSYGEIHLALAHQKYSVKG